MLTGSSAIDGFFTTKMEGLEFKPPSSSSTMALFSESLKFALELLFTVEEPLGLSEYIRKVLVVAEKYMNDDDYRL